MASMLNEGQAYLAAKNGGAIVVAKRLVAREHGNSVHRLFAPVHLKLIREHTRATENHYCFLDYASIPMIVYADSQNNNDGANQR